VVLKPRQFSIPDAVPLNAHEQSCLYAAVNLQVGTSRLLCSFLRRKADSGARFKARNLIYLNLGLPNRTIAHPNSIYFATAVTGLSTSDAPGTQPNLDKRHDNKLG